MTKSEVAKILSVINSVYPNFKPDNKTEMVAAWHFILEDYSYSDISEALKIFIHTSGSAFAPSASELINMCHKVGETDQMSEIEAWTLVRTAISRSTYYAKEEFEKLPEIIQKTVGTPEQLRNWATGDIDAIETVTASNFQRTYRAMQKREEIAQRMPIDSKRRLEQFNNKGIEAS